MQIVLKNYSKLLLQVQKAVTETEQNIVQTVNREKVVMAWKVGQIIDEHLLQNDGSAYGKKLLEQLATDTAIKERALYQMRRFYKTYETLPVSENDLSWSHYRALISVQDQERRKILEDLTVKNNLNGDGLQHEIAAEKIAAKKAARKIRTSAKNFQFSVTRGRLFTYKLVTLPDSKKRFVDCGFNIFTEVTTGLKGEGAVESAKVGDKISLKKSAVDSRQMHTYKAYLERVVDGDTIHVVLDLGFKIQHREILRLTKINAPEIATPAGKKASDTLKKILKDVQVLVVKTNKTDIYGRYLADVFFDEKKKETDLKKLADGGTYLSQLLLDRGVVEVF